MTLLHHCYTSNNNKAKKSTVGQIHIHVPSTDNLVTIFVHHRTNKWLMANLSHAQHGEV